MAGIKKTNAMRMLEKDGIEHSVLEYEFDENDLDGHHVADFLNLPYEEVFKTLVAKGDNGEYLVFCLSVDDEVDLKKAASLAGLKRVEMIHVKDLLAVTGYIRGGCSPIGMKKHFPTFIHETAPALEKIFVSAGKVGYQIELDAKDLISIAQCTAADLC